MGAWVTATSASEQQQVDEWVGALADADPVGCPARMWGAAGGVERCLVTRQDARRPPVGRVVFFFSP